MKLGLGTYALAWSIGVPGNPPPERPLDAEAFLRFALGHGFRLVQMADNQPLPDPAGEEGGRFLETARREGVAIEIGGRGLTEENLRRQFRLAQAAGATLVRMVIDGPGYEPADDDVAGLLREAVPELERFGLVLGIENHDRLPAARLAALVDAADSERVGICLDTVNSFGSCEGPAEVVAVLAPHTVNLHLKDFTIRRLAHNMGFELTGTPAGRGRLRIPWLLDAVARYGRCTTAILELWPPPAETPAATIRREQAWVGESLAALRPHLTP